MLKWILAAMGAALAIFLAVVALQPSDFKIERSATMRVDMDRMVGGMFDQGLNQMKTVVERRP